MNKLRFIQRLFSVTLIVSLGAILFLVTTIRDTRTNISRVNFIAQIRNELLLQSTLVDQYLVTPSPSLKNSWEKNTEDFITLLNANASLFTDTSAISYIQILINNTQKNIAQKELFFTTDTSPNNAARKELLALRTDSFNASTELGKIFLEYVVKTQKKISVGFGIIVALLLGVIGVNMTVIKNMLATLHTSNQELLEHNETLQETQHTQEENTQQLKKTTQELADSEQKLKEQVTELKRFKKLTVDRELAMIKLKEKLKGQNHDLD